MELDHDGVAESITAVPQLLYPEATKLSGSFIKKKPPLTTAGNGYAYCGAALAFAREADLEGDHDRPAGLLLDAVVPARRVELFGLRDLGSGDAVIICGIIRCAVGDDAVVVEEVIDAELDLRAGEHRAIHVVVHKDVAHPKRIQRNSLVESS